jgi:hypothetical protein
MLTVNCAPGLTDEVGSVLSDVAAPAAIGNRRTVAINSTTSNDIIFILFINLPPIKKIGRK